MPTYSYSLHGFHLQSDFLFTTPLVREDPENTPDLCLEGVKNDRYSFPENSVAYSSATLLPSGNPVYKIYSHQGFDWFHFPDFVDFYLSSNRIEYRFLDKGRQDLLEMFLLSSVLNYWLEKRGQPVLHASCIEFSGSTIGLLASSGSGKSTMAISFLLQGASLVSDDLLPIHFEGNSVMVEAGFPSLRVFPDHANKLGLDISQCLPLHGFTDKRIVPVQVIPRAGIFETHRRKLDVLYMLERSGNCEKIDCITISAIEGYDAALTLVHNSFSPHLHAATGRDRQRLGKLAEIAAIVPLRRVVFPSGIQYLTEVQSKLIADFSQL